MTKLVKIILILPVLLLVGRLYPAEWQTAPAMHTPRGGAAAVKWENYIYVFGGKSMNNMVLNTVERFDLVSGNWENQVVPPFEKPRYNAAAIVYDGKIYLIGGRDNKKVFKTAEVFDPAQNKWVDVQEMHHEREGFAAVLLQNLIYLIGGQEDNTSLLDDIEWFDSTQNSWEDAEFDLDYPRAAAFTTAWNDTCYLFGGYYYGLTKTSYKGFFTPSGFQWVEGPHLNVGRAYGATALVGDWIYLIGGETSTGKSNQVELYSLSSGQISNGPFLPRARSGMASVVSGDTIYIIGGFEGENDQAVPTVQYLATTFTPVQIGETPPLPRSALLVNGYPNPFNGYINFRVQVPTRDNYRMNIYSITGSLVKSIFQGPLNSGTYRFQWDGRDNFGNQVASGLYLFTVKSSRDIEKFKVIYVK